VLEKVAVAEMTFKDIQGHQQWYHLVERDVGPVWKSFSA